MIDYTLNYPSSRYWVALLFAISIESDNSKEDEGNLAKFNLRLIDELDRACLPCRLHYCPPNFTTEHISVRACDVPVIMNIAKKIRGFSNFILVRGLLYSDHDPQNSTVYDLFIDVEYKTRPGPGWWLIEKEGDIFLRDLQYLPSTVENTVDLYYLYRAGFFDRQRYKKEAVWKKVVEMYCKNENQIRGKRLKILY